MGKACIKLDVNLITIKYVTKYYLSSVSNTWTQYDMMTSLLGKSCYV